eukprot:TRINITY_DN4872_c0_g1_i1.p1 TRINITY_DN4872_c0_g1~~TRINITY_DN4872_c0_g1_i1.p1  ORF type:complete len:565 (+),score=202.02 TRINITY_DN4872_c0_g1_i1:13-1707(+)
MSNFGSLTLVAASAALISSYTSNGPSAYAPLISGIDNVRLAKTIKNAVFAYFLLRLSKNILLNVFDRGLVASIKSLSKYIMQSTFDFFKKLPFVKSLVDKELSKIHHELQKDFKPIENEKAYTHLPANGLTVDEIKKEVEFCLAKGKINWNDGKVSGSVYYGDNSASNVVEEALRTFSIANPLHPDLFPGVRKMEAEVVAMVVKMFNGDAACCGTMTSGGTESILLAVKTYRDMARETRGITKPNIILPITAHAAFEKACQYFNVELVSIPLNTDGSFTVDISKVKSAINRNTICIAGSAPNFPNGTIDDIEALNELALKYGIPLHVDCCLGGFILPFMEKAGFPIAPFDFRLKGVTSISCDPHKYGFTPKGNSVVMYSSKDIRKYQYFVCTDWPGGIVPSPTMAGTRPGGLIAGCWATMLFFGEKGYIDSTKTIVSTSRFLVESINKIPGLYVLGEPAASVISFSANGFDILRLPEHLSKKGWNLSVLQFPAAIHLSVTYLTARSASQLVKDLEELADEMMKNPHEKAAGQGAIYGTAQSVPDRSLVGDIAASFIDICYTVMD